MTTNTQLTIGEIAENLNSAGIPPLFGSDDARVLIAIWRRLAEGDPIRPADVSEISDALGVDRDAAEAFVREISERDDDDNILGVAGLSLNEHPHQFTVSGVRLSTWCAWDSLFLPPALGKEALVVSNSPSSGESITLTVTPEGVSSSSHPDAVVSMIMLDPAGDDGSSIESIYMTFCQQVHFFANQAEAKEWSEGRDMKVVFLSLPDAFDLGKQAWASLLKYA
ncbi:MAG: hypothetical protein IIC92_00775 [Chloroflexi bacterium]|nr:hypothetical protein [Chloroflexota bacterium]